MNNIYLLFCRKMTVIKMFACQHGTIRICFKKLWHLTIVDILTLAIQSHILDEICLRNWHAFREYHHGLIRPIHWPHLWPRKQLHLDQTMALSSNISELTKQSRNSNRMFTLTTANKVHEIWNMPFSCLFWISHPIGNGVFSPSVHSLIFLHLSYFP